MNPLILPLVAFLLPMVPGVANTAVTQATLAQTICSTAKDAHGHTWIHHQRPPASYTNKLKLQQLASLGMHVAPGAVEEDHDWSIEAGGSPTDPRNLWPQSWTGPWNAHDKDRLENAVHRDICSGAITLAQGGTQLTVNWIASYQARWGDKYPKGGK